MSAVKKTARPSGSNTRARIMEHSILLFNRHGVTDVSIDQIASDLGMSRGNLNYHFQLKRDLIMASVDVLDERLRSSLKLPHSVLSPAEAAQYCIQVMHTLWDFRFFFNGLGYLLKHYPIVRKRYFAQRDWMLTSLEQSILISAERGIWIPTMSPNSYRLLSDNIWAVWLNWLRMSQIESPYAKRPERDALYDGVVHFWSLCQPLLQPGFAQELLEAFKRELRRSAHASDNGNKTSIRSKKVRRPTAAPSARKSLRVSSPATRRSAKALSMR